jgi:hypothetical protein
MENSSNTFQETANATTTKNSTQRTKKHRQKVAAEGGVWLDIRTSQDIKSIVRAIAQQEKIKTSDASESLLVLGIEAYLQGNIEAATVIPDGRASTKPVQRVDSSDLEKRGLSPRYRIKLPIRQPDQYQSSTTTEPIDDLIPVTIHGQSDLGIADDDGQKLDTQTDKLHVKSLGMPSRTEPFQMDREKHKIFPFGPIQPT